MNLPDFLTADQYGEINLTGHRIGLHHVLRSYNAGASAEMIALQYPTLSLVTIYKVIAHYLDNRPEVDAYLLETEQAIAKMIADYDRDRKGPTLAELRKRLEAKRAGAA